MFERLVNIDKVSNPIWSGKLFKPGKYCTKASRPYKIQKVCQFGKHGQYSTKALIL